MGDWSKKKMEKQDSMGDGADEQADSKWAELLAAKQLPEDDTGEEKLVSGRPELTALPRAMTAVVSLCQRVVSYRQEGLIQA